jgi:hypothetical protein
MTRAIGRRIITSIAVPIATHAARIRISICKLLMKCFDVDQSALDARTLCATKPASVRAAYNADDESSTAAAQLAHIIAISTCRFAEVSCCQTGIASLSRATSRCAFASLRSNCSSSFRRVRSGCFCRSRRLFFERSSRLTINRIRVTYCLEMPTRHIYPRCAHSIGAFALRFLALSRLCRVITRQRRDPVSTADYYMSDGHRGQWILSMKDQSLRPVHAGKLLENCDIAHRKATEPTSA